MKNISQAQWMVVAVVLGVIAGCVFPDSAGVYSWHASSLGIMSTLFLRMIKALIAPLLFATLVVGIAGHGDSFKDMRKLAVRSIVYFEIVTTLALAIGLIAANLIKPGRGVALEYASNSAAADLAQTKITLAGVLEHVVPQSIVDAAARNDVLQIVVFAIVFAIALSHVHASPRSIMLSVCNSLVEVMFKFAGIVVKFAPFGVGGAIAATVGHNGLAVLRPLGLLVVSLYGAMIVFTLIVLLPIALMFRTPIRRFLRALKEPWILAFTTASSEAALPLALRNMEQLGVPRRIVSFVLPTGYSFNMDGTALYLTLASVFVAQAAGIDMPLSKQILLMLTLMLTSKGVAAVPRASLVVLSGALAQFGLPLEGIAIILCVDAFMDMGRTSLNVLGNCLASVVMSRWDGSFVLSPEAAPLT